jgi:hypothetical protein
LDNFINDAFNDISKQNPGFAENPAFQQPAQ